MGRRLAGSKPKNKADVAGCLYPGKMKYPLANSSQPTRRNIIRSTVRKYTRSKYIFDTPPTRGIHNEDPGIAHVTIIDSEEEEYQLKYEEGELPPRMATLFMENTDDKIDYVIRVLEARGNKLNTLVSNATTENSSDGEGLQMTYKGLYMDSQRKIEALNEENRQLTMKLTVAEAKIEMLMNNPQHLADLAGKVRDIVLHDSVPTPAMNALTSEDVALPKPKNGRKRGKYPRR